MLFVDSFLSPINQGLPVLSANMGDAGEIAIPTGGDDQFFAQLLVSLGMGEFGSIDALLASDMTPEEMQSPLFAMRRAAAAAAGKRSRLRLRCVWVVLSVACIFFYRAYSHFIFFATSRPDGPHSSCVPLGTYSCSSPRAARACLLYKLRPILPGPHVEGLQQCIVRGSNIQWDPSQNSMATLCSG